MKESESISTVKQIISIIECERNILFTCKSHAIEENNEEEQKKCEHQIEEDERIIKILEIITKGEEEK